MSSHTFVLALLQIKALLEETYGPSASGKKSPSAPGAPKADKKKKDKKAAASPEKASAASQAPKEQKQEVCVYFRRRTLLQQWCRLWTQTWQSLCLASVLGERF